MATKQELLDQLEAAGLEGFSMSNSHAELETAAANADAETKAREYARRQYPNAERYDSASNRAHTVTVKGGRL